MPQCKKTKTKSPGWLLTYSAENPPKSHVMLPSHACAEGHVRPPVLLMCAFAWYDKCLPLHTKKRRTNSLCVDCWTPCQVQSVLTRFALPNGCRDASTHDLDVFRMFGHAVWVHIVCLHAWLARWSLIFSCIPDVWWVVQKSPSADRSRDVMPHEW